MERDVKVNHTTQQIFEELYIENMTWELPQTERQAADEEAKPSEFQCCNLDIQVLRH